MGGGFGGVHRSRNAQRRCLNVPMTSRLSPGNLLPNGRGSVRGIACLETVTEPRPSEAVKKCRRAGETACATSASRVPAMVGQAVSPASPACGRFFHSFSGSGHRVPTFPRSVKHPYCDSDQWIPMKNFERITIDAARIGGVPCVRHLRIPVATVPRMLAGGLTEPEILSQYPDLQTEDVRECLEGAAGTGYSASPRLRRWSGNCPFRIPFEISDRWPTEASQRWQAKASGYPFDSGSHYRLRPVNTLRNVVC